MTAAVGTYELLGTVATTATATVWKARDTALDRNVALKQVHLDSPAAQRVRAEATLLASIRHPNIVTVYDLVEHDDSLWLAEQWIDGAPLQRVLAEGAKLRPVDALALIRGALVGLGHAHDKRIVHGDITPANILIDSAGIPMLVDFGLAVPTGTPGAGGTPGYLAPEVASGGALTARSDVYSAAATLARLLLGRPLFRGSAAEILERQRTANIRLSGVDAPVAHVLHRALSIDPAPRPADADELLRLLDDAAEKIYGAAWLTGSSLGALGGTAATIAAGLQLGGTVVAGGATAAAGTFGGLAAKITGKQILIASGATILVAAGAIIGYNALTESSTSNPSAAEDAPRTDAAAAAGGQPQHPSAALSGSYDIVATVTTSNNIYGGSTGKQMRWTMQATPVCPGPNLPCSVGITTSDDGANAAARFANGEWTATRTFNSDCVDDATGVPNGKTNSVVQTTTMSLTDSGVDGKIVRVGSGGCDSYEEWAITGTRAPR